jgi:UDP-N-acetylglucosamine 2-epimerase
VSGPIKLLICLGTRPEAIKLAPVISLLRGNPRFDLSVCSTGQHRELLDSVLKIFAIVPNFSLDVMRENQQLDQVTASVLTGVASIIKDLKPDRVIVQGDTTTALAASLAAYYERVSVGHVEAGLRTGDISAPFPEEFNRRTIDLVSDLLWVPTSHAAQNLCNEVHAWQSVLVTGNTVIDAMRLALAELDGLGAAPSQLDKLIMGKCKRRRLVLVTAHRRESFDSGIAAISEAVAQLARRSDIHVVWPLHPNPRVSEVVTAQLSRIQNVSITPPLDYLTFLSVLRHATLAITDSGGIQEEAPWLRVPLLVTRKQTERPEGIHGGVGRLMGTSTSEILTAANDLLDNESARDQMRQARTVYGDGFAAERIRDSILAVHQ